MQWIICKASRLPHGHPYAGPTCAHAGVPAGKVYDNFWEAVAHAMLLGFHNPVKFHVVPKDY